MVFRLAGGGRLANEVGFYVMFKPYDSADIVFCTLQDLIENRIIVVVVQSISA